MTPLSIWSNTMQASFMLMEAQAVIAMRLLGMAGGWSVPRTETNRMMSEKVWAATKAMTDVQKALMTGGDPSAAALKPYRQKTRANSRRLAKRGPRRS